MTYVYRVKPFLRVLPQSLYGIPFCIEKVADRLSAEMRNLITLAVLKLGGFYVIILGPTFMAYIKVT